MVRYSREKMGTLEAKYVIPFSYVLDAIFFILFLLSSCFFVVRDPGSPIRNNYAVTIASLFFSHTLTISIFLPFSRDVEAESLKGLRRLLVRCLHALSLIEILQVVEVLEHNKSNGDMVRMCTFTSFCFLFHFFTSFCLISVDLCVTHLVSIVMLIEIRNDNIADCLRH